jgi:hypothetical protein
MTLLVLAILFFAGLGYGSLLWPRTITVERPTEIVLKVLLGSGALGLLALAGVMLHALPRGTAIVILLSGAIFGIRDLAVLRIPFPRGWDRLLSLLFITVLIRLVVLSWLPVLHVDSYAYHYTTPRQWLIHGGFFVIPYEVHTNFYHLWSAWLYWGICLAPDDFLFPRQATLLSTAAAAMLLCWELCRRGHPIAGWVVAFLWMHQQDAPELFMQDYMDMPMALMYLAAVLCVVRGLEAHAPRPWLVLAGAFLGFAIGMKITGLFFATCLGVALLFALRGRYLLLPWIVLPAAILWIPWAAKSALITGNPLYPFFIDHFPERPGFGQVARDFLRSYGYGSPPLSLTERIAQRSDHVVRFLRNANYLHANLVTCVFALLALVAAMRLRLESTARFLIILGVVLIPSAVFLEAKRFALPATIVQALAAALILARLSPRNPPYLRIAAVGLSTLVAAYHVLKDPTELHPLIFRSDLTPTRHHFLTTRTMHDHAYVHFPLYRTSRWLDETLTRDDRLLVTDQLLLNALTRVRIQSNPHIHGQSALGIMANLENRTASEIGAQLNAWGITHILTNDALESGTLLQLRKNHLEELPVGEGAHRLYRLIHLKPGA